MNKTCRISRIMSSIVCLLLILPLLWKGTAEDNLNCSFVVSSYTAVRLDENAVFYAPWDATHSCLWEDYVAHTFPDIDHITVEDMKTSPQNWFLIQLCVQLKRANFPINKDQGVIKNLMTDIPLEGLYVSSDMVISFRELVDNLLVPPSDQDHTLEGFFSVLLYSPNLKKERIGDLINGLSFYGEFNIWGFSEPCDASIHVDNAICNDSHSILLSSDALRICLESCEILGLEQKAIWMNELWQIVNFISDQTTQSIENDAENYDIYRLHISISKTSDTNIYEGVWCYEPNDQIAALFVGNEIDQSLFFLSKNGTQNVSAPVCLIVRRAEPVSFEDIRLYLLFSEEYYPYVLGGNSFLRFRADVENEMH